jgi:hypothetical protein
MTDLTAPVESRRNDSLGNCFARLDALSSKTDNEMLTRVIISAARNALIQIYQEQRDLESASRAIETMARELLLMLNDCEIG